MPSQVSVLQRVRFFSGALLLYGLSIACVIFALRTPRAVAVVQNSATVAQRLQMEARVSKRVTLISGRPIRITIPSEYVDLPLIPGTYDKAADSWTLSGYEAQFATTSAPANNIGGETFIYGHNNDYVFGALRHVTPAVGATAFLYTGNHHVFEYKFQKTWSVGPYDVATLDYSGKPTLLVQTCTGSFNEWRTMYRFDFEKVVR
jgi:LPXTG-site transpeptidase (sortase) family protein